MSVTDIDRAGAVRMIDYLQPADLNTDGCVSLAEAVLRQAAYDLGVAAQRVAEHPTRGNFDHMDSIKAFYRSDLFTILCAGVVDGETAMREIIRQALRGHIVNVPRHTETYQGGI